MSKPVVVICSSASFYEHVNNLKSQLETKGIAVVVPETARKMAESDDYNIAHYKTWFKDNADYHKKAGLMRTHFDEIAHGDMLLVVNDEKHGKPGYIGPNVLMEMSLAWYLHKPIYVLYDLPADSPFEEELRGMQTIQLDGKIEQLPDLIPSLPMQNKPKG
jgi:hypothetical protein